MKTFEAIMRSSDLVVKAKDAIENLPWYRKQVSGWPIETYKDKPIKSFFRLVVQNLRKPWDYLQRWLFHREVGRFAKFSFPIIKNMSSTDLVKDLISVQPMNYLTPKMFYTEIMDRAQPRVGQVYDDGPKYPKECDDSFCCLRDYWSKVWTPEGWVSEKTEPMKFQKAFEKYNPLYKAEIEKEKSEWNKEHGISSEDLATVFPMTIVCDSSKQKQD
jgi:hypothetical protein